MISKKNNLIILDCESRESTLNSISKIYEVDETDIVGFLTGFDLEKYYLENELHNKEIMKDSLIRLIKSEFGIAQKMPELIYWFHGTRTLKNEKFEEGILPLGEAIDKIWNNLYSIFSNTYHYENLRKLRKKGLQNFHYNNKLSTKFHWGPYARLIKEAAFCPQELWSHDYLAMPEIIEDICESYSETYGESLLEEVRNKLFPCIVKFKSTPRGTEYKIHTALFYLYHSLNNLPLDPDCDTSYDAGNKIIPKSDIIDKVFIQNYEVAE